MTIDNSVVTEERIAFLDLQAEYRMLAADGIEAAILDSLRRANYIHGKAVQRFEEHWAGYCGTSDCVAMDSGTAALEIALKGLGIGPGDEVIVPAHTFIATAAAVALCGARPVFVDADPVHWQIDPAQVQRAITARTRALIAVHLYGQVADLDALGSICRERGLVLIEDAAQAQGALWRGKRAGAFGKVGCFSFYPAKNLGAFGDAGAITTSDTELAIRMRRLCNHGRTTKYRHAEIGENLRMDEMQGVVLDFKLPYLDGWNERRRSIAEGYRTRLHDLPLTLPEPLAGSNPVYHLFPVATPLRDELAACLASRNIDSGIHYPVPLHLQPAFAALEYREGQMPMAERIGRQELSLPIGPMMSDEHVECVCDAITQFFREH